MKRHAILVVSTTRRDNARQHLQTLGTILLSVVGIAPAFAQPYAIVDLGNLGGTSYVHGMNDSGQVVGQSFPPGGAFTHPFVWQDSVMENLGTLGGTTSESGAGDVNNLGQIVGWSSFPGGGENIRAFFWQDGVMTEMGTLGGASSSALGINDQGLPVGWSHVAGFQYHACSWNDPLINDLGTLGGVNSLAHDVNDRGQIVGWSDVPSDDIHAFIYEAGVMSDIDAFGSSQSMAHAINELGDIAGVYRDLGNPSNFRAFVWQAGRMTDLGTLGGDYAWASGINDDGMIVGSSSTTAGELSPFIWRDGTMTDVTDLLQPGIERDTITVAKDVDENGRIVGYGWRDGQSHVFMLTPLLDPGDADADGDIDGFDYAVFDSCVSGPGVAAPAYCAMFDFDGDEDVDFLDFSAFQAAFTGPN